MTSKEALERLYNKAYHDEYLERVSQEKAIAFLRETTADYNTIKQDLERLEKLEKVIDILKLVIELPLEDDIDYVDSKGNNLYKLRIKRILGEEAYKKVKEVLENE